tara:strand:+ start:433 stop:639 length:207 start_codon:yes stop_codon:yes gene_type:complete
LWWRFSRSIEPRSNELRSIECEAGSTGFFSNVPELLSMLLLLVAGGFLAVLALTQFLVRRSMDGGPQN